MGKGDLVFMDERAPCRGTVRGIEDGPGPVESERLTGSGRGRRCG